VTHLSARYLLIPAAGLGTRMRSVNPGLPKEMLPVGGKPVIQYAIEEGLHAGIRDIIVIINRDKDIIRRFIEDEKFRDREYPLYVAAMKETGKACSFTFLYQERPLGESDAICLAKEHTGGEPVAVIYPDNVCLPSPGALRRLQEAYSRYQMDVTGLMEVSDKNAAGTGNAGRVDLEKWEGDVFRIVRIHPKGTGTFVPRFPGELRTCGMSISGPHLYDYIDRARPFIPEGEEFIDVPVRRLILEEKGILGVRLPGTVFDVGNPEGYSLCQQYLGRKERGK